MSWTPSEFRAFLRGAKHRQVDGYELAATSAMFNRYAQNSKRANIRKMFNAEQAHHRIDQELSDWREKRSPRLTPEMYHKLKAGLNGSVTSFRKGGKP